MKRSVWKCGLPRNLVRSADAETEAAVSAQCAKITHAGAIPVEGMVHSPIRLCSTGDMPAGVDAVADTVGSVQRAQSVKLVPL